MQPPDSIHSAAAWLVVALLGGFAWSAGAWLFGLNSTTGKIIAVVVLLLIAALLILGHL